MSPLGQGWRERAGRMLRRRFPDLFALMPEAPTRRGMDPSIARDGLLFERGWLPLVVKTCERLAALIPPSERKVYQVVQIKEKWGELRIYLTHFNPGLDRVIRAASKSSVRVCERCGRPGKLTTGLGPHRTWVQTVCSKHGKA